MYKLNKKHLFILIVGTFFLLKYPAMPHMKAQPTASYAGVPLCVRQRWRQTDRQTDTERQGSHSTAKDSIGDEDCVCMRVCVRTDLEG